MNPALKPTEPKCSHLLYKTWEHMVARCYRPTHSRYKYYGGRGIKVCDSWRNDFWTFVADMGPRPEGLTLDRKENDGDYEPSNCRWATMSEQNSNRRPPLNPIQRVTQRIAKSLKQKSLANGLLDIDHQLLSLLVSGLSLGEAAERMGLRQARVSAIGKQIMKFTGVSNWMQVGIWYAKNFPERCS